MTYEVVLRYMLNVDNSNVSSDDLSDDNYYKDSLEEQFDESCSIICSKLETIVDEILLGFQRRFKTKVERTTEIEYDYQERGTDEATYDISFEFETDREIDYEEIRKELSKRCNVEYSESFYVEYYRYTEPAVYWLSNGDPGYPAEDITGEAQVSIESDLENVTITKQED